MLKQWRAYGNGRRRLTHRHESLRALKSVASKSKASLHRRNENHRAE